MWRLKNAIRKWEEDFYEFTIKWEKTKPWASWGKRKTKRGHEIIRERTDWKKELNAAIFEKKGGFNEFIKNNERRTRKAKRREFKP